MLKNSEIERNYKGYCSCLDIDSFLKHLFKLINKGIIAYSHLFYNFDKEFIIYCASDYNIGIYFNNLFVLEKIKGLASSLDIKIKYYD